MATIPNKSRLDDKYVWIHTQEYKKLKEKITSISVKFTNSKIKKMY